MSGDVGRRRAARDAVADPDLVDVRASQADRRAFGTLYRRYLDRVYGYAFYLLGDHHDAEDVTERTFLAALAAIGAFRDEGASFRAWLFRIAHNQVANALRTRGRRPAESLDLVEHPPPVRTRPPWWMPPMRRGRFGGRSARSPPIDGRSSSSASSTGCRRVRSARCSGAARAPSGFCSTGPCVSSARRSTTGGRRRPCNVSGSAVLAGA
jgi:RNA polymerase sigma factor (sigma-70 family)